MKKIVVPSLPRILSQSSSNCDSVKMTITMTSPSPDGGV